VNAAATLSRARARSGLSRRELARRAGTSPSTLAAYEAGRKAPSVATLDRIVRAAGFELGVEMAPGISPADPTDPAARGPPALEYPRFGRA
jgi:transcriptional regulator with XRE-family HTH domain